MFDWIKISDDPNNEDVLKKWLDHYNQNIVKFDIFSTIHRDEFIMDLCGIKKPSIKLLDIGFAEHSIEYAKSSDWFHGKLRKYKHHHIFGLDINQTAVEAIRQFTNFDNLIVGDATSEFALVDGGNFDAIHAGDVIEHLDNVGGFLRFCRANLSNNGKLIITTPNPCSSIAIATFKKHGLTANMEHTNWVTPTNMNELCRRNGLTFLESHYHLNKKPTLKNRLRKSSIFKKKDVYIGEFIYVLSKS